MRACCLIGEENVGNEAEWQAYDANTKDKRVEKQNVNDADGGSRHAAKGEMHQGKHDHQERDNQSDHDGNSIASLNPQRL